MTTLLVLFALACGGGTTQLSASAPPRTVSAAPPTQSALSVLSVPVLLPEAELVKQVQSKLPTELVSEEDKAVHPAVRADLRVTRTGEARVKLKADRIKVTLPADVVAQIRPNLPGPRGKAPAELTASLDITASIRPELTADWLLLANTEITYKWTKPAKLSLGLIRLDISKQLDQMLPAQLATAATKLDADLKQEGMIRAKLQEAWSQFGKAEQLAKDPPVWLRFGPQSIHLTDPDPMHKGLMMLASITGTLDLTMGDRPPDLELGPLPDKGKRPPAKGMQIRLPLRLQWSTALAQVRKALQGQEQVVALPTGGHATVRIVEVVDLYPSGEGIAIGVRAELESPLGNLKLLTWLQGRPVIENQQLRVEDFTYTADSNSMLLDSVHSYASSTIRDQVATQLVVGLAEELETARTQASANIGKPRPGPGPRLEGRIDRLDLTGIEITEQYLIVHTDVRGEISARLED